MDKLMKKPGFKRAFALFLVIMIIMIEPLKVFAHNAYFLQVLVDENQMNYYGAVIQDKANMFKSESSHIESTLGNFEDIKSFEITGSSSGAFQFLKDFIDDVSDETDPDDVEDEPEPDGGKYKEFDKKNNAKKEMVFTFPPVQIKRPSLNNASQKDIEMAYSIRDTLIPGINQILLIINDGKRFNSIEELITASESISGSSTSYNGWNIRYKDNNIIVSKGSEEHEFIYEMSKGYSTKKLLDGSKSPVYNDDYDYGGDVETLNMTDLIIQANYAALVKGILAEDEGEYSKPSTIEQELSALLSKAVYGIRNLLGLFSINDLVYNQGIRSKSFYYKGVLPNQWMELAVDFHLLLLAIAWSFIGVAVIKLIFMKNISTVNPSMRVSLMDGVKDLLLTGFLLATNLMLIIALFSINEKIVNIFSQTTPNYAGFTGGINSDYETFAGSLMQIFYLVITIYLNISYIFRGLYMAVLVAIGPFAIMRIAFGGRGKNVFGQWLIEVVGNIFVQSMHAFMLSLLLAFQMTSSGITAAAIAFSLIPMTKQFRSMMFGDSGFADSSAGNAMLAGTAALAGVSGLSKKKQANKSMADKRTSQVDSDNDADSGHGGSNATSGQSTSPMDTATTRDAKFFKEQNMKNGGNAGSIGGVGSATGANIAGVGPTNWGPNEGASGFNSMDASSDVGNMFGASGGVENITKSGLSGISNDIGSAGNNGEFGVETGIGAGATVGQGATKMMDKDDYLDFDDLNTDLGNTDIPTSGGSSPKNFKDFKGMATDKIDSFKTQAGEIKDTVVAKTEKPVNFAKKAGSTTAKIAKPIAKAGAVSMATAASLAFSHENPGIIKDMTRAVSSNNNRNNYKNFNKGNYNQNNNSNNNRKEKESNIDENKKAKEKEETIIIGLDDMI